jgi:Ca2+-dependent lipid-binding protein
MKAGLLRHLYTHVDTQSIGIVRIDVYEAKDMVKLDVSGNVGARYNGSSASTLSLCVLCPGTGKNDPYVVTTLDPPPYSGPPTQTRVIENCEHPIWHETHFHKVPQLDIVDEHIKLRLSVFDWDRLTTDDHIGSIWYDLKNAIDQGTEEKLIHDG